MNHLKLLNHSPQQNNVNENNDGYGVEIDRLPYSQRLSKKYKSVILMFVSLCEPLTLDTCLP
jgi:hypothetical protein